MAYPPHPYAALFPMMTDDNLKSLTGSIGRGGLQEPIVLYEGEVLDGRNRQIACSNANIKPVYIDYTGDDPLGYVTRANLDRRHLTTSQRGAVAAELANLESGQSAGRSANLPTSAITQSEAAALLDVSPRTLRSAKAIKAADPELFEKVKRGEVTIEAASKQLAKPVTKGSKAEVESNRLSSPKGTNSLSKIW